VLAFLFDTKGREEVLSLLEAAHPSETTVDINAVHRLRRRKQAPTNGGRSGIKIVRNLQRMFHSVRIQAKRFS